MATAVDFFDAQFRRQLEAGGAGLNPFEAQALPHLRGRVLDCGCGLGNLAVEAARRGCSVDAVDGSHAAVEHLREVAKAESLPIRAAQAELRTYPIEDDYDTVVCIGLLMFFDCGTAASRLEELKAHVKPRGVAIVNVLVEGTTYMDMFEPAGHCLFAQGELERRFEGWEILSRESSRFPAPQSTVKAFETVIARRP